MNRFRFQDKKKKNYFEGWYLRFTDSMNNDNYAIIFAMTKDKNDPHSFIQFFDGVKHTAKYYRFPLNEFSYEIVSNTVKIGKNILSPKECHFEDKDILVDVKNWNHITIHPYNRSDSAMGPLANAPLECFQEVIFLKANCDVSIQKKKVKTTFSGNSYMEKTYGTNFPTKWIWLQSNYSKDTLLTFSVGLVPILFFKIKGFFLIFQFYNREYRFSTYNFSRLKVIQKEKSVTLIVKKKCKKVVIEATTNHPVELVGPRKKGIMDLKVFESLTGKATLKYYEHDMLIFEDTLHNCGLELMYK